MKKQFNNKAFTLIELIVVMAVISTLVLLAIPKFMGYTEKARLTELKSNIKQLENASERYYMDKQDWPRLNDTPYTADQLKSFAQEIKDKTGAIVILDSNGKYYDIDYNKLQKYVQEPKDSIRYIIQNPVGEVFYLDKITEEGKQRIASNNTTNPEIPVELPEEKSPITKMNFIESGHYYSLSLTPLGELYGWGYNINGQLGNGTNIDINQPKKISVDNKKIKYVSAGLEHTLVLTEEGDLYTWGRNNNGQLGDGTTINKNTPTKIDINESKIVSIAAGYYNSLAITENGELYSWGYNNRGQVGDGTIITRTKPVKININNEKIIAISVGQAHSLAVTELGTLYSWGFNSNGQLGVGHKTDISVPTKVNLGTKRIIEVATGYNDSFAITDTNELYGWGWNSDGEFGINSTNEVLTPMKITAFGSKIIKVAVSQYHTLVLRENGDIYSCGLNSNGQLGDGTTTRKYIPVKVNLSNVKDISVGIYHSVAITDDGSLYTWGQNSKGQLGDGTTEKQLLPVKINIQE